MFKLLYHKFIQDIVYQILSELTGFCVRYEKNILGFFRFTVCITNSLLTHCRRGPVRYKFHTLYELDNLAVVNVKDTNVVKNAFKLLMFPDTRLFQAESPKAKVTPMLWCFTMVCCYIHCVPKK